MKTRLKRLWARRNDDVRLTKGVAAAIGLCVSVPLSVAIILGSLAMVKVVGEAEDRVAADRRSRGEIERIVERVVRVEGVRELAQSLEQACRRFPTCAAELDRAQREQRAADEAQRKQERRRRDGGPDRVPEQRADRPPRPPVTPAPTPDPVDGGDGPDPPSTATPATRPPSPAVPLPPRPVQPQQPAVRVDPPAIDLDGDQGLLPRVLPDLNLPEVDAPPLRVPGLPRIGP